jgi:hypothetical protein
MGGEGRDRNRRPCNLDVQIPGAACEPDRLWRSDREPWLQGPSKGDTIGLPFSKVP